MKRLLLCAVLIMACQKASFQGCDLLSLYQKAPYPIGVAVDVDKLETVDKYRTIVLQQFNSITAENVFKWASIHPEDGEYDWAPCDYLADFTAKNHKRLHGHTLLWHGSVPDWVNNYKGDFDKLVHDHIAAVVGRYKGRITSWDVVNEGINNDGSLRSTIWSQKLGSDYIAKAFRYAHEADPNALLFYNDYNLELIPAKLNAVLTMCTDLRKSGVQIDGIGVQMHINNNAPSQADIEAAARRIADAGFLVHFSELDISMNEDGHKTSFSSQDLTDQAARYYTVFNIYNQLNKKLQYGITLRGVSDADSWIMSWFRRADIPLLFDEHYQPKPAYCACKSSFK